MLGLFRSPRRGVVLIVEASLLATIVLCAAGLTLGFSHVINSPHFFRALGIALITEGSLYYHGLYGPGPISSKRMLFDVVRAISVAALVLWLLFHFVPQAAFGRGVFVSALGSAVVVLPLWRATYQRVLRQDRFRRPTLIVGSGELARASAALIQGDGALGLKLLGTVLREGEAATPGLYVLGSCADLRRICDAERVGLVLIAAEDRRGTLPLEALLELKFRGVDIEDAVDFYERVTGRVCVRALRPSKIILSQEFCVRRSRLVLKRILDVALAFAGIVLSLPLMALTALAIKVDSAGPVFYSQIRAGAFGKPFRIYKFRSMRPDAEAGGAAWAQVNDPRVTLVGRFIRKTRLDELPQLWNVFVGQMSLVGPRPERPEFIERLEQQIPFFRQRLCIKPGITGHAQVCCPYGASVEDAHAKLEYDLFYIKRLSFWFDLSILIDTVKVVLLRIGAR